MSQSAVNIVSFPVSTPKSKAKEVQVADVSKGFTRMSNEIIEAAMLSDLTKNQMLILLAVNRKTEGYNKKMDWVGNAQLSDLTGLPETRCSATKNELIRMNVLITKGRSVGVNPVVSEWETKVNGFRKTFTETVKKTFTETVNGYLQKPSNTKDNLTKDNKDKYPLTPKGESEASDGKEKQLLESAKAVLSYYNEKTGGKYISPDPFLKALTATKSRRGYTEDEIKLVIDWTLACWDTRHSKPSPANLCRMTRFDGYLSDATTWNEHRELPSQMLEAYNNRFAGELPEAETLTPELAKATQGLLARLKEPTLIAFDAYLEAFQDLAGGHYYGENKLGWKADLEFLLRVSTLEKTRSGSLMTGGDQ